MNHQDTPNNILVDVDAESQRDLHSACRQPPSVHIREEKNPVNYRVGPFVRVPEQISL
jgi:hypothetical protein